MGQPALFSPCRIGTLEIRNRLVMSPMETSYATREGLPSSRTIHYYEARARGGVGLITLGACTIDERHREVPNAIHFGSDDVIEAHRALTERVHAHGAAVQPQLVHPGPDGLAPFLSGTASVGPSVIPSYLTGVPSRELAVEEVRTAGGGDVLGRGERGDEQGDEGHEGEFAGHEILLTVGADHGSSLAIRYSRRDAGRSPRGGGRSR